VGTFFEQMAPAMQNLGGFLSQLGEPLPGAA
jgi:hypothetical protein